MKISRRRFVTQGLAALSLAFSTDQFATLAAQATKHSGNKAGSRRILVVIQLNGGNDGLNTVIPYTSATYYGARPNLAIPAEQVLKLNNQVGLHPGMDKFASLYKDGKLVIVQNAGYPNPNRSHFRSSEIWQTAEPDKITDCGWLGRYLDCCTQPTEILPAVNLDPLLPLTLQGRVAAVPSVSSNINNFKFFTDPHYQQLVKNYPADISYPPGEFSNTLKSVAQMIAGGLPSSVYTTGLDGFDTHTAQTGKHAELLKQLSDGVYAFYQDLVRHSCQQEVVIMIFSEFGRQVAENDSRGTDHGTAAPMFILGHGIKGGILGETPDLRNLDNGDLKFAIDFRQVYASLLEHWLATDSQQILGQKFATLPLFA